MLRPEEVGWFLSPARYRWSLVQLRNYGIIWRLIIEDWAGSLVVVVDGSGLAYVLIPSVLINDRFVVVPWLRLNVPSHNGRITCSDCEVRQLDGESLRREESTMRRGWDLTRLAGTAWATWRQLFPRPCGSVQTHLWIEQTVTRASDA
jgi:hypothetical protein